MPKRQRPIRSLLIVGAKRTDDTRQQINNSPETQDSSRQLVRMVRRVWPSVSTLVLTDVRCDWWTGLPSRAMDRVGREVVMGAILGLPGRRVHVQKMEKRT